MNVLSLCHNCFMHRNVFFCVKIVKHLLKVDVVLLSQRNELSLFLKHGDSKTAEISSPGRYRAHLPLDSDLQDVLDR